MLRHVVLLELSDTIEPAQVETIVSKLMGLRETIPEIEAYSVGADVGISEGNSLFAIIGDFADAAAYKVYAEDPVHLQVIADHIKPFVTGRTAVQYEF